MSEKYRTYLSKNINREENASTNEKYAFRLYVTGTTVNSLMAIKNIKKYCDELINDNYSLEIIDLFENPVFSKKDQIIAVPTLIKKHPQPVKRIIGSLSEKDKFLMWLDL